MKVYNILNYLFVLNSATDNSGVYGGAQHWVYYLIGAIFLVLAILCAYVAYRWRHSREEAQNYNYNYNEFVRFWQLNKFAFMICLTVVLFLCAIIFFLMNSVFLKNVPTSNQTQTILELIL